MLSSPSNDALADDDFLRNGGAMGEAMRALDWTGLAISPPALWPRSLKTIVRMMLDSRYAMWLAWGPELTFFCNDAYRPTLGAKRNFLGAPASRVWAEIWPEIGPRIAHVLTTGEATWDEGLRLFLERSGFSEETYHSFSYSPVHGDRGGVEGMLCVVTEETARMLSARRLASLGALAGVNMPTAGIDVAARSAVLALAENPHDLPFAMLYLNDADAPRAQLVASFGPTPPPAALALDDPSAPWQLAESLQLGAEWLVDAPEPVPVWWPASPWDEPIQRALVLPLTAPGRVDRPFGFLIAGISPRLPLDADYRRYLVLAAAQIANSVSGARAFADATRQAESLAELDRAKTAFFANVSHELRTPLTLILGPLGDLLRRDGELADGARHELGLVERNAQRLLKLVNMLLDFSRIEAGRLEPNFVRTDLAQLTAELASIFTSPIEHAGLRFEVVCDAAASAVDIDPDLWEKIVLNLLSNAFKFTFEGAISVCLQRSGDWAVLRVTDTGTGMPAEQLPKIFDRFQRLSGVRSRTQEGAGIGLALVKELVGLHDGRVEVESEIGRGTAFTITVPLHQAESRSARTEDGAEAVQLESARNMDARNAYVADALRAAPAGSGAATADPPQTRSRLAARVLIADDNADMRDYLLRLLAPHWNVGVAADGAEALRLMRAQPPDLLLTDVMMPGLDGFSLLEAMRRDPALAEVPVVMLSARAGEEARIEGLRRGADDYLVKPFSGRELVARIDAQLSRAEIRALRTQLEKRLTSVFENAPVGLALLTGSEHVFEYGNREHSLMVGGRDVLGLRFRDALPELAEQGFCALLDDAFAQATPFVGRSKRTLLHNEAGAPPVERYFDFVYQPMTDNEGRVTGIAVVAFDVTGLNEARREAESANRTKDEFLAVLGHELRNPLAPIVTALHLMRMRGVQGVDTERQIIERQVGHMVRLVDDLMDVSRIFSGKLALRKSPVALAAAASQALEATGSLFEQKRQIVSVDVPEAGLDVLADPVRLSQMISNLLTNAARYTPSGGHVKLGAERRGGNVMLRVDDDGVGLRAEDLSRIFEMFVQAPQRNDRAGGGLGLGLSIARSLARQHGGELVAESAGPGYGSRFTLTLPALAEALPRAAPDSVASVPLPTGGQALLVVDDNRDAADSLVDALRLNGYPTEVAYDAADALERVREHPPALAILDIGLPLIDGIELTRQLKRDRALAGLKVIALTGYGLASDRARSHAAGVDAHVVKPVDIGHLTGLIAQLLRP